MRFIGAPVITYLNVVMHSYMFNAFVVDSARNYFIRVVPYPVKLLRSLVLGIGNVKSESDYKRFRSFL